jgi:hypothetical protein
LSSKQKTTGTKRLVRTKGIGLSVKLYKMSASDKKVAEITKMLGAAPYKPSAKSEGWGFVGVKAIGQTVAAEFLAGFRVAVLSYDKEGDLIPVHYMSVDRGEVLIKLERQTVEVRGSERIARKFKSVFEEQAGIELSPLNLDGGTKKLYDAASDVASVLLTGVEKGNLTQAEFRGSGIQQEEEIGLYTRRYKGQITRFRGTFPYPSGAFLTTTVNAQAGSLMVYKSGDGLLEKDLNWIVELMEDAALGHK